MLELRSYAEPGWASDRYNEDFGGPIGRVAFRGKFNLQYSAVPAPTQAMKDRMLSELYIVMAEVEAYQDNMTPSIAEKETAPKAIPQTVEDYIKARRDEGVHPDLIAAELYSKKGNFKLTHLEITRVLGLGEGLRKNQIYALKQRGRRACQRGEKSLQEHKRAST